MTENAFITEEACLALTPNITNGYRAMPFIRDNMISEADGTMKIIEEFGSKKHEEKVYD